MNNSPITYLDRERITASLDQEGYCLLPKLLDAEQARALGTSVMHAAGDRVQQSLEKIGLGRGALWRLIGPSPNPLDAWRDALYELLAPIANKWNAAMGSESVYPAKLSEFHSKRPEASQDQSHVTLSRLREDDYQALHQSTYGEIGFPLQLIILLSEPGADFVGGEFVMTEQRPRMQSRPMVLPLRLGDAALITVATRPFKGSKGYYRVNMKHAVSRVRQGERLGLELLLHDVPEVYAND